MEPWGPEAAEFTRKFLASGPVRLAFDRERVDQYGRQLAYVWVGERLLNEELLRAGLARWEPNYHYQEPMKQRFRKAQKEAQAAERSIWSDDKRSAAIAGGHPTCDQHREADFAILLYWHSEFTSSRRELSRRP